jgi:RNA recognition motif-containing protein
MEDFTHAYCDMCSAIQPVIQESLTGPDTSGKFIGGDLLCNECRSIIATLYKRKAGLVAVEKERPYATTDAQLQEIFSAHGTVESARVIMDKFSGRSKGFGFVEMSSSEEAQRAIQALNGTDLEGRTLTVNEARPQQNRSGGGERRGGGGRNRW